MPTPSPNQPPDQATPPPYAFSTCPDDQPHPARQTHDTTRPQAPGIEVGQSPSTAAASPATYSSDHSRDGPTLDESMLLSGQASIQPSPRPAAVPRRPLPSGALVSTVVPNRQDGDDLKNPEIEPNYHPSRESSATSGCLHVENAGSIVREPDSADWTMQEDGYSSPSMGVDYSSLRTIPISPSSYLRPGSRFHGTQQSERQVYEVQVEIKHVDMRESFLCGYLRIQGLTEDHPTLTTYFEGEIIGSKYSFYTKHDDWGASAKVDLNHWSKFSAFRPFHKSARKGPVTINDVAQKENIFMRWKEHFLVPDHRVRTITGASFEGFYYICFNQLKGEVSGIYFHSKSEKFQQLELKHVPDRGCFNAMEFR